MVTYQCIVWPVTRVDAKVPDQVEGANVAVRFPEETPTFVCTKCQIIRPVAGRVSSQSSPVYPLYGAAIGSA